MCGWPTSSGQAILTAALGARIVLVNGRPIHICFATFLPVLTGTHSWCPAKPQSPGTLLPYSPSVGISGSDGFRGLIGMPRPAPKPPGFLGYMDLENEAQLTERVEVMD